MMSQVQLFPLDWNMTDFHQRLRHLRTARKLTQTRVAELLGFSPRVYTRWENGGATPLFGTVVRIADILGVSLDVLAGRSDCSAEPQIRNPELHRLYKKVDLLSDEDQKALLVVLDSLVKRSRVRRVMAEWPLWLSLEAVSGQRPGRMSTTAWLDHPERVGLARLESLSA
jgi:transcriptional regulator with XRE-family HTH domain